jgi:hypothetical protein
LTSEKTIEPKKMGFDAAMESLGGRKVLKPSVEFFLCFLFRFLSKSTSEIRIKPKKVGFDAAMLSKAALKVQKPRLEFLFYFFISLSEKIDLGDQD